METEQFKNAGEPWTKEEEDNLNKLYNEDMLDIMEISKIHCRAPSGILTRLKQLEYITHRPLARGYNLYKNSNFYKQSVLTNKDKYKKDLTNKISRVQTDNAVNIDNKNEIKDLQNNVNEIKTEIQDLQNSIKEMNNKFKDLEFGIKQFIEMLTTPSYEDEDNDEYEGEDDEDGL
jgi:hypothetical protein